MSIASGYKIRVKLGQAEFDAEGPEETVKKDLANFLQVAPTYADQAVKRQASSSDALLGSNAAVINEDRMGVSAPALPDFPASLWDTTLDPMVVTRLFKEERNDLVSLRVLPSQSEDKSADTVFLLLFGFLILKGQSEVKASDLLVCAKQSGIALGRIDQMMEKQRFRSLIKRGGSRNWSRYALTNPGILHAENVASKIFG